MHRFSRLRYVLNMVVYGSMDLALVVDARDDTNGTVLHDDHDTGYPS